MLEIYDCSREELRIGPFSYEPMRAVDIWLQQSDEFLLQSLSSSPDVAPPHFVPHLRSVGDVFNLKLMTRVDFMALSQKNLHNSEVHQLRCLEQWTKNSLKMLMEPI